MIRAIVAVKLKYPFNQSMGTLLEFCSLWGSSVLLGSTNKPLAAFSMPQKYFKRIVGENPRIQKYSVPSGMERFISSFQVIEILVK